MGNFDSISFFNFNFEKKKLYFKMESFRLPIDNICLPWKMDVESKFQHVLYSLEPEKYPNIYFDTTYTFDETLKLRTLSYEKDSKILVHEKDSKILVQSKSLKNRLNYQNLSKTKLQPIFPGDILEWEPENLESKPEYLESKRVYIYVPLKLKDELYDYLRFLVYCLYFQTITKRSNIGIVKKNFQHGTFGELHSGYFQGKLPAVFKRINLQTLNDMKADARYLFEFQKHPSVCRLYNVEYYDNGGMYIGMEAFGIDLLEALMKFSEIGLPEYRIKKIVYQLLEFVKFMHGRGKAHMDLKPENILIDESTDIIKVIDFGLVRDTEMCKDYIGTKPYMAPEVAEKSGKYYSTQQADMWSIAVIVYMLYHGEFPYPQDSGVELIRLLPKIVDASKKISMDGKRFLKRILESSPRPLCDELLTTDPWVLHF